MPAPAGPTGEQRPRRRSGWPAACRQAGLLLALAVLLAGGSWALRSPRLPLRAKAAFYELDLPAPLIDLDLALQFWQEGQHLFVDIRPEAPAQAAYIPGAFFIRAETFADDLYAVGDFIFPTDPLILYGNDNLQQVAAVAYRFLDRGYEDVSILAGGIGSWQRAGGKLAEPREQNHDQP